jgi:catechol 1,2-dioxygenase
MERRKFLITSTLTAVGLSAIGAVLKNESGAFKGDCDTTNDILGPFYREDAPLREDMTYDDLEGNRIQIKGRVFQPDCTTPIKDALVEIWHCNIEGEYDNDSDEFRQRAGWKSDEIGAYSFKTIMPGKYLNGKLYRPAHIHFRVQADGYKELVSQIYFSGDPHITKDPWASQGKAKERILPIIPEDTNGNMVINFDIYLKEEE